MKRFTLLLLLTGMTFGNDPRPANADLNSWIRDLGPLSVTSGGTVLLPQNVIQSQIRGEVSGPQQFILQNHVMNRCIEKAISTPPPRRSSYKSSKAQFDRGVCILTKCFQEELLMMVLPGLINAANDPASSSAVATMISQFQSGPSCDGSSDRGIDPLLISLLTARR